MTRTSPQLDVSTLNSVGKAFCLLETMARRPRAWGISELARELKLNKSNVYSHLQTLIELGYLRNDPASGKYSPTLKLWEVGLQVSEGLPIRRIAQPQLAALSAVVQKTVHLSVLEGDEVVYIDRIEAPTPIQPAVSIGSRAPAECVATGLAMMSLLDNDDLRRWDRPLRQPTEHSPKDFTQVMELVSRTRARGYAITRGSWRHGVLGIGAALRVTGDSPFDGRLAAIGLSCLDINITDQIISDLADYVVNSVARLKETAAQP